MKQSTNYNMNKPDPNDMFSLEHWNQNTDKIDETLAPTFEDYTGETPVPTTDEALKNIKSKTKLSILMQNIKAFCKGCCTLGMLVDNCVTNNNNLPLAASQGKILMDQITSLNSDFKAKDAFLEIGQVERGAYIYLRNKVTNNLLMLRLNEDDKKLVFNSEIDGQWGTETELVTKSDMKVLKKTDVQFSDGFAEISFPGLTYDSAVCINQEYKSSAGVQNLVFTAQVRPNELIIYARNANDGSSYNGIIHIMAIAIG